MKHGKKPEKLYPTMADEPETIYPFVSFPFACLEGKKYQPGDKVRVELLVEIESLTEQSVGGDLLESEIESDADEKAEGEKNVTPTTKA